MGPTWLKIALKITINLLTIHIYYPFYMTHIYMVHLEGKKRVERLVIRHFYAVCIFTAFPILVVLRVILRSFGNVIY